MKNIYPLGNNFELKKYLMDVTINKLYSLLLNPKFLRGSSSGRAVDLRLTKMVVYSSFRLFTWETASWD